MSQKIKIKIFPIIFKFSKFLFYNYLYLLLVLLVGFVVKIFRMVLYIIAIYGGSFFSSLLSGTMSWPQFFYN
jgi:hypothetical protein